jgi:hypothetical protein
MKTIAILFISVIASIAAIAQTTSTVTINVRGNNNRSVIIDGSEYTVTNDYNTNANTPNANTPIVVSNLQSGQHTLQIRRDDEVNPSSTSFTVRNGYDLHITIAANGSVQSRETKWKTDNTTGQYAVAMSVADYNNLYNGIRNEWRTSRRMTLVSDALANTGNYFTTAQARQLIQLINNQSNRFTLAKASYARITDPTNFTDMYELFNSQTYKDQLRDYVNTYSVGSSSTAMNAANFNNIYRTARQQSTANSRVSYVYNAFSNTNNYFTVAQARQLVQIVPDETNRLYLAKISYRSIVDKNNFSQMATVLNSQSSRNELITFVNNYDVSNPIYTRTAMKETEFNTLYRDIQNRFGIGAKLAALNGVFDNENYYFTTAQARQLIQLVSDDNNRLQLAKDSYDNIVDQSNFNQLYDILSSSSRNEIELYVRNNQNSSNNNNTSTVRTPMSTSSYNSIYNRVRNTWGIGAKMTALTEVFDNESYYFTVAQAKQLIQLVSTESNRLQLAKAAYGNITDPENFNQMYELLSSQSSKNELSNYVNTYSYNR